MGSVFFLGLLALACVLSVTNGGRDERLAAAAFTIATFATALADRVTAGTFVRPEVGITIVDAILLLPLLFLVLRSRRFWPLWATGFHLITLLTHILRWVQPGIKSRAYALYSEWWAAPVLVALILGCVNLPALVMKEARPRR